MRIPSRFQSIADSKVIDRIVLFVLCMLTGCSDGSNSLNSTVTESAPQLADSLSAKYSTVIGDAIGEALEAKYVGRTHVIVLDRYIPRLRLFTVDGHHLWSGVGDGGGPGELDKPQALAASDSIVLVVQRGRISQWHLEADSLRFGGVIHLDLRYFPFGVVEACNGTGWILYARNDDQLPRTLSGPVRSLRMDFLHVVRLRGEDASIWPIWSAELDPSIHLAGGHTAAVIGRLNDRLVLWHRPNHKNAGSFVELNCNGDALRTYSERALVTGDSLPVLIPRPRALEWTAGVAALSGGVVIGIHRYFSKLHHGVDESHWKTELFSFLNGRYGGSMVLEGQWFVMDSHADLGVLATTIDPTPHFVRFPSASVASSWNQ